MEPKAVELALSSGWDGNWLVLRCGAGSTLKLALALVERDVRAWTPLWVRKRRYPRSKDFRKIVTPCLPSFVFVPEDDIDKARAAMPGVSGCSVMKSYGMVVKVKDTDLSSLRDTADLHSRKQNPFVWPTEYQRYRVISGAFQGLEGMVVGRTAHHSLLDLERPGFPIVKIPPFLLSSVGA